MRHRQTAARPRRRQSAVGDMPIYRDLGRSLKERGRSLPRKGAARPANSTRSSSPPELQTALYSLYSPLRNRLSSEWDAGIASPPVFIVVCNNTATSKLVYEWISGFQRKNEDGETLHGPPRPPRTVPQFRRTRQPPARPNTLLIDSEQIESGEALDPAFRDSPARRSSSSSARRRQREGAGAAAEAVSDAELLREVMNTVGKPGRLGEGVRCVVSVSMLTEGWDTNTVTHILGVRAFGTQLLCEQVVGRGLRRQSYELDPRTRLFDVEYADIMGIPFDFTAKPVAAPIERAEARRRASRRCKERAALEIVFPRVEGYRVDLPDERLQAQFTEDSRLVLTPEKVGPCTRAAAGHRRRGRRDRRRRCWRRCGRARSPTTSPSTCIETRFRDAGEDLPRHLFGRSSASCAAGSTRAILSPRACRPPR